MLVSDEKWASQISDDTRIVTKFVTKNFVFVTEYILLQGIGDEWIFVTLLSQIMNYDEKTTFYDTNQMLQKATCLVVNAAIL